MLEPKPDIIDSLITFMRSDTERKYCTNCGEVQTFRRRTIAADAPDVLIIQLNRHANQGTAKNNTVVDVSSETLNLPTGNGEEFNMVPYSLRAVLGHQGTTTQGHYFALVKYTRNWFWCSDAKTCAVAPRHVADSINTKHAAMLVYERAN